MEDEAAEHRADDERLERGVGVVVHRRDRGRDRCPVADGPRQRRAGAAQVGGTGLTDADEDDQAQVRVAGGALGHGDQGHLAGGAGQPVDLRHPDQVGAELVGQLGRPRPEQHRAVAVPRQDRERDDVDAADRAGERVTERELGRVDLSGEDGSGGCCG
ncbi:hypothetical protein L615_005800000080 [Nocardioides sp. J9]|nr:hypothetical protein L615_005800000080 [Nocardioides sp. J9]